MTNLTREDISRALGYISDRHIEEVLNFEGKKKNKNIWLRFTAIAACLAIVVGAVIVFPMIMEVSKPELQPGAEIPKGSRVEPTIFLIPIVLGLVLVLIVFLLKKRRK